MDNSIQKDALKSSKRKKAAKIIGIVAAVLLVVWTIYSVSQNLNKNERMIFNSFIKACNETAHPEKNELIDCSEIFEGETEEGKDFKYVIAEIKNSFGNNHTVILIVSGKKEGNIYNSDNLSEFNCVQKEKIKFEISQRDESVNLQKIKRTLTRYWKFYDKM